MRSFALVFAFLAALAAASPAVLQTRNLNTGTSGGPQPATVLSTWTVLNNRIQSVRREINGGGLSEADARARIQDLTGVFESALTLGQQCTSCFNTPQVTSTYTQTFQQFQMLTTTVSNRYGPGAARKTFSSFGRISNSFNSFFQTSSSQQFSANRFVPAQLIQSLAPVVPAFASIN